MDTGQSQETEAPIPVPSKPWPGSLKPLGRTLLGAAAVASPFATHFLVATGAGLPVAVALATAQWCLALGLFAAACARRGLSWMTILLVSLGTAAAAALAYQAAGRLPAETGLLVVAGVSHLAINSTLLAVFASTLLPGRTPLVVAMGRRLDPLFNDEIARYARTVTWAWCAFFVAQIGGSALLLAWGSAKGWSLFVNVLDMPLVATMFVAEDLVRRMRFPAHPHVSLPSLIRAVRQGGGLAFLRRAATSGV